MIPIVSAEMVPFDESAKYSEYLAGVKFASRLAADSAATAAEFTGFVSALATQGLRGPQVREIALGSAPPAASTGSASTSDKNILVVGSHEPRKNHLAVLHAAELLWREGLAFSLTFIGGSGWGEAFPRRVRELQNSRRDVSVLRAASESDLEAAYSRADFTVFPSLHEGFGLPVTESLARGVPVITSNFGAPAELGSQGGALLIDSRDDGSLTEAMRRLLTDPDLLHRLSSEARRREVRTWSEYAEDLWDWLVEPERRSLDPSGRAAAESGHAQATSG
jgi:glycosyltransferase involved in cell wall biosynthesis